MSRSIFMRCTALLGFFLHDTMTTALEWYHAISFSAAPSRGGKTTENRSIIAVL